jgi:large subunit ribosomal protein L17
MACSLIEHKRIKTTVAKAKALRKFVEPLITKSKTDTTHSRRIVFSHLRQKEVVTELFGDVASKVATRDGGYTRILRTGNRLGDNAEMCLIELVDYNDTYTTDKPKKKAKSTRRSGGAKKTATPAIEEAVVVEEAVSETKAEEVVEETPATDVAVEATAESTEAPEDKEETKEENNAKDNETKSE